MRMLIKDVSRKVRDLNVSVMESLQYFLFG